ncbi:major capsid protein [Pseudonocardia sp. NPDC049635]|uniref:major capsid protein n=1 Tax=Pseudonocardia sp. NPDC049635 TaxID=3155506 RepID=UPI00340E9406
MDETIKELLAALGDATGDQLTEAREAIAARMQELAPAIEAGEVTEEQHAEIEALGDAFRQIKAEQDGRAQAAAERSEAARGVLDEVAATAETDADADADGEDGGGETAETEGAGDGEESEETADADAEGDREREPVAASANRPALGRIGARTRRRTPSAAVNQRNAPAIYAAADTGYSAGHQLTRDELASAMANRLRAVSRATSGRNELVHVATFKQDGPKERHLVKGQLDENTRKIEALTDTGALVAAGGLCAPFTPDYSIDVVGSIARPVRDALVGFTADRGGIWFRPNLDGAATAPGASGVWTNDMDAAVGTVDGEGEPLDPDPKPYAVVDCPDMIEAEVEAETFQLEFSNVTTRFDPESTAANIKAAMVAHARWSENRLLRKLMTASTTITWDSVLGATRDVLAMLDQVIAYKRSVHRLDSTVPMRMILPLWVQNMLRVDVLRALHTSNDQYFSAPDSLIARWFSDRNVNITWHLDGEATAAGTPAAVAQRYGLRVSNGDPVPPFPTQVEALLYLEGEWLHLDGGELDLGVVRDSRLIEQNRYRTFTEEWVGVAFKGIESLRIVADLTPNGASAGTVEPAVTSVGG